MSAYILRHVVVVLHHAIADSEIADTGPAGVNHPVGRRGY